MTLRNDVSASNINMDEREALKRQIDLLQNLINNHKSVHGDVPSSSGQQWHSAKQSAPSRSRGQSVSNNPKLPSSGGFYTVQHAPQSTGQWRKTYSLSNTASSAQHGRPNTQTARPSSEQHRRPIQTARPSSEHHSRPIQAARPSSEQHSRPIQTARPSLEQHSRPTQTARPSSEQHSRPTQTARPSSEQHIRPIQTARPSSEQHSRLIQTARPSSEQHIRPIQTARPSSEQPSVSATQISSTGFLSLPAPSPSQPNHNSNKLPRAEKSGCKRTASRDLTGAGPRAQHCPTTKALRPTVTGHGLPDQLNRVWPGLGSRAELGVSGLTGPGPPEGQHRGTECKDLSGVPGSKMSRLQSTTQLHIKPRLIGAIKAACKQNVAMTTTSNLKSIDATSLSSPPLPCLLPSISLILRSMPSLDPPQTASAPQTYSKFTWVKSHQPGGAVSSQDERKAQPPVKLTVTPIPVSHHAAPGVASHSLMKRTSAPSKKASRKLSLSPALPKTSTYTWVSSTARGQARLSRKPLSPKALPLPQRASGEGLAKKPKSPNLLAKQLSSRYRWKAGPGPGGQASSGVAGGSKRGSVFRWTSEKPKSAKGVSSAPSTVPLTSTGPSSSPGGFKLRSRMKIIRRSAGSVSGSEKRFSPTAATVNSCYSLRRRTHTPLRTYTLVRSPAGVKRTSSRDLVSFGKHKLRRLSASPSNTGPAFPSLHSHTSQRGFRTRYKIVTRLSGTTGHPPHYLHALSWRAKRIQTARNVLQSRLRPPGQDKPPSPQTWRGRGRGMRWIGGTLYSVSANKLSRTVTAGGPVNKTVRWSSPQQTTPAHSSTIFRPSSTRFVASRVVQRSLAIIRQARQKKPHRHYCMYYNRFGKCNRGNTCPYIHDPDKVAVCTRFLRGTCKQTDGTCPFSHKVAKEKMPVCSYFLRGICNNSSCPYSHVYVSRKAAVCQDFIRGYCPQGEKCKKKHTLVCPDFSSNGSCPRGAQCKLHHHQRTKRSTAPTNGTACLAKKARSKSLLVVLPQAQAADSSLADPGPSSSSAPHITKLPSFISLSSSPEDTDPPNIPSYDGSMVPERILQIKPRL
ncbi:hypothetical protein UPYG_G00031550 [Umbra pygmaea]|uniref:Zinc finger CCCH domain-containing protein 3 n=1 Tax=Umbra pygmaea TaxID=75934 RepID=A0ABD0XQA0_UMBPY